MTKGSGNLDCIEPLRRNVAEPAERIDDAQRAFRPRVQRPGGEYYLFVLEDTARGEIVGTSGIAARVGGFDPWYSYEIRRERFSHPPLKIEKEVAVLDWNSVAMIRDSKHRHIVFDQVRRNVFDVALDGILGDVVTGPGGLEQAGPAVAQGVVTKLVKLDVVLDACDERALRYRHPSRRFVVKQ